MTAAAALPSIIQGGMGVAVSSWQLANLVASRGQLGVVSGTAVDTVFVRRLQDGDPGGHVRRALEQFPWPDVSAEAIKRFFVPGGKPADQPYALLPMHRQVVTRARHEITVLSNFVEVWLARQGHDGPIGINLLTKVQMPNLASLYGAMLAGVDYVLMGAGIPRDIPGALDRLALHEPAEIRLDVDNESNGKPEFLRFEPARFWDAPPRDIGRPSFLPIVSASSLALMMTRKANGRVDGFVVEGPTAGGHNAPPRGQTTLNERGEPVYGERDAANLAQMREIGLPFWLAGGSGSPEGLRAAQDAGAAGIQVGTLFAYTEESGLEPSLKRAVLERAANGGIDVLTDPIASPTGFPFKVVQLAGTNADADQYQARKRVCDLGYLRVAYRNDRGTLGYRCAAEPVDTYVKKGGDPAATVGRKCLCNALLADIGHAQIREGGEAERPLLTSGDDLKAITRHLNGRLHYSAHDVLDYLLGVPAASRPETRVLAAVT